MTRYALAAAAALMTSLAFISSAAARDKVPADIATEVVMCPDGSAPAVVNLPGDESNVLPSLKCEGVRAFDHPGVYGSRRDGVCSDGRLPVRQITAFRQYGYQLKEDVCRGSAALTTFGEMAVLLNELSAVERAQLRWSVDAVTALLMLERVTSR